MQARKIRYEIFGLIRTTRHWPLNTTFDTGEERFLGTCDSRGVGGVDVLVNTNLVMNVYLFEQLTTRIGSLRLRRCGSIPALTILVAHAIQHPVMTKRRSRPSVQNRRSYTEIALHKHIISNSSSKIGPKSTPEELHIGTHGLQQNDQGERLSEFFMTTRTIHSNSQLQKPWTWELPGGEYHNEIDIIVNRRFCLTDVGVVPKFYTESDHRFLRARFFFLREGKKAAKFKRRSLKPSSVGISSLCKLVFEKMPLSTTLMKSTSGLFIISATARRKPRVQEPPRGDCLTRRSCWYSSVEPREPQATTSQGPSKQNVAEKR